MASTVAIQLQKAVGVANVYYMASGLTIIITIVLAFGLKDVH